MKIVERENIKHKKIGEVMIAIKNESVNIYGILIFFYPPFLYTQKVPSNVLKTHFTAKTMI